MKEENQNLCCVFFSKFSTLFLHLVHFSHHGAVGSAYAWQTRGSVLAESFPLLSGRLITKLNCEILLEQIQKLVKNNNKAASTSYSLLECHFKNLVMLKFGLSCTFLTFVLFHFCTQMTGFPAELNVFKRGFVA